MGLVFSRMKMLLDAKKSGTNFSKTVMIGRQKINLSKRENNKLEKFIDIQMKNEIINFDDRSYADSLLKEYLDINVKNDELLVKLASIVQRLIQAENKSASSDEFSLSDGEKAQLLSSLDETVLELQKKSDDILDDIDTIGN